MKITSNYNLSFNKKVNKQQSKKNPNFGINTKILMLPIEIGTGVAALKLMPVPGETVLAMYSNLATGDKDSGLTNLPADDDGYTRLHYLCEAGNFEAVKKFLDENPNINLSQMTKYGDTCMSLAIDNKKEDIINLIAGMDNYNPNNFNSYGFTDFHRLCEKGYTDAVKTLLEKHPEFDINQRTYDGYTCMYLAATNRQVEIVNIIAGIDKYNPAIPDKGGWTDLHYLCRNGYTDVIKTLSEKHPEIDFNQQTEDGDTCMSLAVNYGHENIINLIANTDNYNPGIPDKGGWTDLHSLCENGYTEAVKTLLEKHPEFDINQQTKDDYTCMSLAIKNKHGDIINIITSMDKYNPAIPDEDGYTDFHRLCENGYTDAVKTILEKHPEIDINQQTKNGNTCMSLATWNKQESIINLIAGMDNYSPVIPNKNEWTDLHRLCRDGYTDAVKALLEKYPDVDINQQTKDGNTCMSLAAINKQDDTINLIAGMDKYDPTIPNKDGKTDFHHLCGYGYTDVVKTLLEKHPEFDINQQTIKGDTCMSLAMDNRQKDIINLIAGMDSYNPAIPDKGGWTDLHWLCRNGYTDAVKTILEKHPEIDINQKTDGGDTCMSLAIKNRQKDIINLIANTDNYKPDMPDKKTS